jgi:glutamyl-tRNA synthetase
MNVSAPPFPVRVRFAPSPTGHLHVGGARTAIFNWLFAKHHGGTFIIRVEDTDQARSTRESEAMVLDDLRWLGLQWDEGPDAGGPHVPYRQSERVALYGRFAHELIAQRHAYRCFCSEEELEAKRKIAEEEGRPPHYDLTCWRRTSDEVASQVEAGKPFAIRFHVPREEGAELDGDVTIHDLIRGEVTWKKESLGDFILVRSDGLPTYNFSVVVDDHDMQITHVVRAEEHLTNTHRQVLIYRAMQWTVPFFAHVSLILGSDRSKLSKRHGATSVSAYAEQGYLPAAMVNYLTMLGWSAPDGRDVFSTEYASEHFSLDRVNSAPAVFDPQKLEWMNAQYIHAMSGAELLPLVRGYLVRAEWLRADASGADEWLAEAIEIVKKSVHRLEQFVDALRFVFEFDAAHVMANDATRALLADDLSRTLVLALESDLRTHGAPLSEEQYKSLTERLKQSSGAKGKALFMPLRIAITGLDHGPELVRIIPLLERGSAIAGLGVLSPLARVELVRTAIGG